MTYIPRKKRVRAALHDVSLTPLIDVALTLLIIFMVTSPMLNNVIKVTLPKGVVQEGGPANQEVVVYIDQAGTLFFEGNPIDKAAVIEAIKKVLVGKTDSIVFVKGDIAAKYGIVMELIDAIKSLTGVQHVALATQKCS